MEQPVRILNLEDNPRDAELVQARLAAEGVACEIVCVQTGTDFAAALDQGGWALIISDFTLPAYDGMSALALAQTKRPDVPYIFFSGTVGEEAAIEALKKGATDYVLKPRPARLVSAVKRALQEGKERAERKQLEQQLRQAQKMEAIGQLTGGIAHDFNNMLTVIIGYSELMLQKLKADDSLRSDIEQIKEAGERASSLTRQLLAFSRKQVLQPKVFDLNAVLTNMDRMLQRLIGEDIHLVTVPAPGLSTVFGIVKQSEGYVWVYSEVGRGTTFKIYLPRVEAAVETVEPSGETARPARGSETILLVEDDHAVRTLIRSTLQAHGYTVLEASQGKEALLLSGQHKGLIHMMVTDTVMPGMSRRELAERLKPLRPNMKALFMSVYTDKAIVHHGELDPGTAFLQKPFTPDALARKVREVLDSPPGRQGV